MNKVVAGITGASVALGSFAVGMHIGQHHQVQQMDRPVPVVVTNDGDVVLDMPAGVRWDVVGLDSAECQDAGGIWKSGLCQGIDF